MDTLQIIGLVLAYALVAGLCLLALALSCVSLSGTWVVALASLVLLLIRADPFPGWWTVGVFLGLCALVEAVEALAGTLGVARRGGSGWAGLAALVGGLAGLLLGSSLVPVVGSLVGMMAGGFALVFLVEYLRLRAVQQAAHIAWGSVLARVAMVVLKVMVTLGMIAWLALGMVFL